MWASGTLPHLLLPGQTTEVLWFDLLWVARAEINTQRKWFFPPKEWQASSLWLSLCLTWRFIRAVKGYMAYYGPLWPLCSLSHGAHATVFSFNVSPMSARKTCPFRGAPGHFQDHHLISAALTHQGTTGLENRRNIRIHKQATVASWSFWMTASLRLKRLTLSKLNRL